MGISAVVTAVAAVAGVGLSGYSAYAQSQAQSHMADTQAQQEAIRRQQMELDSQRRIREAIRQGQRARAQALATSVGQGAGYDSTGLFGGYGQIQGATDRTILGVNQGKELGSEMFGLNQQLGYERADSATASAYGSLGGSLISALGPIGNLSGGFTNFGRGPAPYSQAAYNAYGSQGGYAY